MTQTKIPAELIAAVNDKRRAALDADYVALAEHLSRRGIDIEAVKAKVAGYGVAVPSWGVGTGGTRFARFPGPGEPRHIFDKLDDCGVIQQMTRATPTVSLHIPWDKVDDIAGLKAYGESLGLGFDAMNSNTFQDQPGQAHSYKYGSLSHADAATRAQAAEPGGDLLRVDAGHAMDGDVDVAAQPRLSFHMARQIGEEFVFAARQHEIEADSLRGRRSRLAGQAGGHCQNVRAGMFLHARAMVQHAVDGRFRDAGQPRDLVHFRPRTGQCVPHRLLISTENYGGTGWRSTPNHQNATSK